MGDGFQFLDIILFAMVAAFLVFRLRNVLGKRDGHEGGYHDPFKQERDTDTVENDENVIPLPNSKETGVPPPPENGDPDKRSAAAEAGAEDGVDMLTPGMRAISAADSSFSPAGFLAGADAAFEMVLNAFASGDTVTLKNLLSAEVFSNFSKAISDREQAGETLEDTLVDIRSSEIVEAYLEGRQAVVTVKFITDQVNATRDENGDVVDGNPTEIVTITDFWTFARDTKSRDPNWILTATRSMD